MKRVLRVTYIFFVLSLASPVYAAVTSVKDLIKRISTEILQPLVYLLFGVAFVVFIWGIIQYVIGSRGDQKKLDQGKQIMVWGIIGLFVMASAWGIVKVLCNFFGTGACGGVPLP